jgi:thiamine pyrophosphate-dependent acetolactate synthase large subunit-like protein
MADTRAAIARAYQGAAVVLSVPEQMLSAAASQGDGTEVNTHGIDQSAQVCAPAARDIELVADLLQTGWAASRPLILAGRGALLSGAGPALQRLGELTGALLATTLRAPSLFAGDPYNLGLCGSLSSPVASDLIAGCDCVLCFGASLNDRTTYGQTLLRRARVVQVDTNASAFGLFVEPELAIRADAMVAATALADELEQRGHHSVGLRSEEIRIRIAGAWTGHRDQSRAGALDPRSLVMELDRMLPQERTVVMDGGEFMFFGCAHLTAPPPSPAQGDRAPVPNFLSTTESGSIGHGLGVAIGAAIARPGRSTVLNAGDAGFMMSMNDLGTAATQSLPLVVIVSNDGAWGSELRRLRDSGLADDVARVPAPSLAGIATAMGAQGYSISSLADLDPLAQRLQRTDLGPLVLDCLINPDVSH